MPFLRRTIGFILAMLLLSSCGPGGAEPDAGGAWRDSAQLEARESPEELYRAALDEDTLVVYANSTRILAVKKSFEQQYPGLVVEIVDTRTYEIIRLLRESHAAGRPLCDLVILEDQNALLSRELVPNGILCKYVPWDIADKLAPGHNTEVLTFLGEAELVFYNDEACDGSPLSNWWELTEPAFRDRVYLANPMKSTPIYALFLTFLQQSEAMAAAYQALRGAPLSVPAGSDAGREFIRRLMENGAVLCNSSDEVSQVVGASGQTDPPVGIMISSKVRNRDLGYRLAPIHQLEPFAGIYAPNCAMLVTGAPHVNAAKLFIRWLLGEADGGGQGLKPYLQQGTWPVRSDVAGVEPVPLSQINLLQLDKDYIYQNREGFEAFWNTLLEDIGAQ